MVIIHVWCVVVCWSLSLAQAGGGGGGGGLFVGHGVPVVWGAVLLPLVCGTGAKKVRGDVDHGGSGGGSGGFTATSGGAVGGLERRRRYVAWGRVQWS